MAILFGWQYFMAPKTPPADSNSNTAANSNTVANTATPAATQAPAATPETAAVTPDTTPNRIVTIKSDLYEVKIDSKGAVPVSWILLKTKSPRGDYPIYADGSNGTEKKPLQLISEKALSQNPREVPFRLTAGDPAITTTANERNYQISVAEDAITLNAGEEKTIDFSLTGENGLEVKKTFVFRADSYMSDLAVTFKKDGQPVPNAQLAIGASIGDHAINFHTLYHTESEAVAAVNGDIKRHLGNYAFTYDVNGQAAKLSDSGTIDWVAMSDAYFAMAAIPASPVAAAEYKASKYDVNIEPTYDSIINWVIRSPKKTETRHLVTAYMPVPGDGSVTKIFTGPKDYFLLNQLSGELKGADGRAVSIIDLINFSNYWWLRWLTKPLSIPILYALNFFNALTHNYGVAIIVFTFLFYMLLFPLRWSQSKSFKKASGNAPKMKGIQDKIKDLQKKGVPNDDPKMRALQMEQLKMTKDALPIGGCLPMLLQFPLLIAFYTAITIALDVRQASFLWLPDLSAADPWHILEFAFALSMILSMKFTPQAAAITPEQQMQQKMIPSGLLLYWFFGNIVSFGQQMVINRLNTTNTPPGTEIVDSVPKGAKQVKPKMA
ncbi:MAG: membrane protein insertase YidC [Acidobacteria bacterium]|nr:membrane protein insertase YidC [Acidobacteriota bacterium]